MDSKRCFYCNSILLTKYGTSKNGTIRYQCAGCHKISVKYKDRDSDENSVVRKENNCEVQKISKNISELHKLSSLELLRKIKKDTLVTIAENCTENPKFTELGLKLINTVDKKHNAKGQIDIDDASNYNLLEHIMVLVIMRDEPVYYKSVYNYVANLNEKEQTKILNAAHS